MQLVQALDAQLQAARDRPRRPGSHARVREPLPAGGGPGGVPWTRRPPPRRTVTHPPPAEASTKRLDTKLSGTRVRSPTRLVWLSCSQASLSA